MKRNPITLAIGLLLVLIFGLSLVLFQVRQTEFAIVTTFGKPTRPITEPGRHWKWPWPIQLVYKFDQRIQNLEDVPAQGLTIDGHSLLTSVYVGWKITDPAAFFPKFPGRDESERVAKAQESLESLVGNIEHGIVGSHPLSHFISPTDDGTNFLAIEREILSELRAKVQAQNYGVDIKFVGLRKLELPANITETVFEEMKKERGAVADRIKYDGEKEAAEITSRAKAEAANLVSKASLQADLIRAGAEAEAAKSLAILQSNPELANALAGLDALEALLKNKATLIFDPRMRPFDLFMPGSLSTNLFNK